MRKNQIKMQMTIIMFVYSCSGLMRLCSIVVMQWSNKQWSLWKQAAGVLTDKENLWITLGIPLTITGKDIDNSQKISASIHSGNTENQGGNLEWHKA